MVAQTLVWFSKTCVEAQVEFKGVKVSRFRTVLIVLGSSGEGEQ